ncbi:MAG: phage terminase large subunit [Candidatus Levyibacteriota bacterium]
MDSKEITFEEIIKNDNLRKELARKSHYWFFHIYFNRYVTYKTADFQKDLFLVTEGEDIKNAVIVAFRGSGKSTIMTLSYPIWAILGQRQAKYIVILAQTQQQARRIIDNIKREFEANELLIKDFGPFMEQNYEWSLNSLSIPQFNARIDGYSSGESIRGIRHGNHRPQIIVADDVEDLQSVRTKETRDKIYTWFTGDILGLGDKSTKTILIGNHLHFDSLIERRKKDIKGKENTVILEIPLIDENGINNWPGKYETEKDIEDERKRVGSEAAWQREYLLNTVSDSDQVIHDEWIHYYDGLPDKKYWEEICVGVDLAVSQQTSADRTSMASAIGCLIDEKPYIYILPNPINQQLTFPQTIENIKALNQTHGGRFECTFCIENVAYQQAMIQTLENDGINVEGVNIKQDKRSRLAMTGPWIQDGKILFPHKGCEDLLIQMLGFGVERHDDLVDAFTLVVNKLIEKLSRPPFEWFFA